jgi:hypothetical protein
LGKNRGLENFFTDAASIKNALGEINLFCGLDSTFFVVILRYSTSFFIIYSALFYSFYGLENIIKKLSGGQPP